VASINISRLTLGIVINGAIGTGPSNTYFQKDPITIRQSVPGCYIFIVSNVQAEFSGLIINLDTTISLTDPYWETVATWTPLTQLVITAPCTEGFWYRLNVSSFVGGASFDCWAGISNGSAGLSSGTGGVER